MQGKVEICGVNTASLPVLKNAETKKLLEKAQKGDRQAREKHILASAFMTAGRRWRWLSRWAYLRRRCQDWRKTP